MATVMESAIKVSVLVPIYNVEKYLRQCLESVVNQTLKEIEIICLNDGSTDGSLAIIEEFAANDDRIVIIDKKNSGYGDSMNQGLKKAKGEYIGIVESDDWIELDAFERMYRHAKANDVEVVRANYYFYKGGKDKKNLYIDPMATGRVVDPVRQTWIFYQAPAIWSAIYKRSFLEENDITFLPTPGASYQDTGFNFKVWASAHRAFFTTETFLHYRTDNEASSVKSLGKVFNIAYEYEDIEKFLREKELFEELGPVLEVAKLGAYYWNVERLKLSLLPKFLTRMKAEYKKADSEGVLIEEYSVNPTQWKMMKFLLKHSIPVVMMRLLFGRMKNAVTRFCKKIWIVTHPSFQKQRQIREAITELFAEVDFLESELKSIKKEQE